MEKSKHFNNKTTIPSDLPPSIRSLLRKKLHSYKNGYKKLFTLMSDILVNDAVRSYYAVTRLLKQSGIDLRLFNVFSFIVVHSDLGRDPVQVQSIKIAFKGIFAQYLIARSINWLIKANYIKQYNYNPRNPSGPDKHIILTTEGKEFYINVVRYTRNHLLKFLDDPGHPDTKTPPVPCNTVIIGSLK